MRRARIGPRFTQATLQEAYTSNQATPSRYLGWDLFKHSPNLLKFAERESFTVLDLVARSQGRFQSTGGRSWYHRAHQRADPDSIYLTGEIRTAWDLIEDAVRQAITERVLIDASARTPLG